MKQGTEPTHTSHPRACLLPLSPWQVWDAENLTCLATLAGHQGPVRTLVRCGNKVFSGSYDKTVRLAWGC